MNVKGTYIVNKYKKRRKNIVYLYLQNNPQTIKKIEIGTYISIITLNINAKCSNQQSQTG